MFEHGLLEQLNELYEKRSNIYDSIEDGEIDVCKGEELLEELDHEIFLQKEKIEYLSESWEYYYREQPKKEINKIKDL